MVPVAFAHDPDLFNLNEGPGEETVLKGRLVTIEEFEAMIDGILGLLRTELSGLPARISRDDLIERRRIENEVDGVPDRANEIADRLGARRPAGAPVAAPLPG